MTLHTPLLTAAVTATLWLGGAGAAVAQTKTPPPTELEAVTVVAPRVTYERGYRPGGGAPRQVRVTQQTAVVDASDLDLTRIADMQTLKTRVDQAAKRVCDELTGLYPTGEPDPDVCARRASTDAMAWVEKTTGSRVARD